MENSKNQSIARSVPCTNFGLLVLLWYAVCLQWFKFSLLKQSPASIHTPSHSSGLCLPFVSVCMWQLNVESSISTRLYRLSKQTGRGTTHTHTHTNTCIHTYNTHTQISLGNACDRWRRRQPRRKCIFDALQMRRQKRSDVRPRKPMKMFFHLYTDIGQVALATFYLVWAMWRIVFCVAVFVTANANEKSPCCPLPVASC